MTPPSVVVNTGKTFSWTHLVAIAIGAAAMYFATRIGPVGRKAGILLDSAKTANAAFDRGQREATLRFNHRLDSLSYALDTAKAHQVIHVTHTTVAAQGLDDALAQLAVATDSLPKIKALVDIAQAKAHALSDSLATERAGAALTLADAEKVAALAIHQVRVTDSLTIDSLRNQRNRGIVRETALVRSLKRLHVSIGVGPSLGYNIGDHSIHASEISLAIVLSKSF